MNAKTVKLILNQQQLEMMDNTLARGIAPDREALVRLALREFAGKHGPGAATPSGIPSARDSKKG